VKARAGLGSGGENESDLSTISWPRGITVQEAGAPNPAPFRPSGGLPAPPLGAFEGRIVVARSEDRGRPLASTVAVEPLLAGPGRVS
jgi:hypothetical protein